MAETASVDLGRNSSPEAELILSWPDPFVAHLRAQLLAIHSGSKLSPAEVEELRAHGLVSTTTDRPTALALHLTDLLVREEWQDQDEVADFLRDILPGLGGAAVLEVGCSTGRKLRSLETPSPGKRFGVDIDARAIALGYRLARLENQPASYYCCSAHSLPLPDASVGLIICRNALTYMHHRTALREMGRVLKPDGLLFLRFENVLYDLRRLYRPGGLKPLTVYTRNFLAGLVLTVSGWQPHPGGRVWGWRAFATRRRLGKMLRESHIEVALTGAARNCPRFLGRSTQTSLLARRIPVQGG